MTDTPNLCPIRFGWARHGTTPIDVSCELPDGHDGQHSGDWHHGLNKDQPITRISWLTDDRRSYIGDSFTPCEALNRLCVLPAGHFGRHTA